MSSIMVYVIEACGNDYYDSYEFHSVYSTEKAAEECAAHLRTLKDDPLFEGAEPAPIFDGVKITATTLR
jgi:hypothetical protein